MAGESNKGSGLAVYTVEASSGSHHTIDADRHVITEGWCHIYRRGQEVAAFFQPVSIKWSEAA